MRPVKPSQERQNPLVTIESIIIGPADLQVQRVTFSSRTPHPPMQIDEFAVGYFAVLGIIRHYEVKFAPGAT